MNAIRIGGALLAAGLAVALPCSGHTAELSREVLSTLHCRPVPAVVSEPRPALPARSMGPRLNIDWLRAYREPASEERSWRPWQAAPAQLWLPLLGQSAITPPTVLRLRSPRCVTPHKVKFLRRRERDAFVVLDCDGAIAPSALDRLSVLARPSRVPRPALPLPLEPANADLPGEWVPGVRLLHPRLFWLVQSIADAFPGHAIRLASGYRPLQGNHGRGKALDLSLTGVDNAALFRYCRTLPDVGCGYYPNSSFVHVDVRAPGTGHAMWIDVSGPGEKAHYVDAWPGVVERGARQWT